MLDLGSLVTDVPEVSILAVDFLFADRDRDVVLSSVIHGAFAISQFERWIFPGGNDFQIRREGHVSEFEADLVIAFTSRAMADGIGAGLPGGFHLFSSNKWPGDAGAEQII